MNGSIPRGRLVALVATSALALLGFFVVAPIAQDQAYHRFADARPWLGVPHFWNVVTNLPFVAVGALGLIALPRLHLHPRARPSWAVFFAGVLLVGAGSAYYHLDPTDETLVWDRLPMTLGFIGLVAALLVEHVSPRLAWLLWPGLALGVGSVAVWAATGDLRLYYGVQLLPMALAVFILALFPAPFTHTRYLGYAVALYAAAKLVEATDRPIAEATADLLSGHPLKHLFAAAATLAILLMLRRRAPRPAP